jgi:hypothetical protein
LANCQSLVISPLKSKILIATSCASRVTKPHRPFSSFNVSYNVVIELFGLPKVFYNSPHLFLLLVFVGRFPWELHFLPASPWRFGNCGLVREHGIPQENPADTIG